MVKASSKCSFTSAKDTAMQATLLSTPPVFDATQWPYEPNTPMFYTGVMFDFSIFTQYVQIDQELRTATILGVKTRAFEITIEATISDPNHPLYFQLAGQTYDYAFSIWSDRISIEVCRPGMLETMFKAVLSVMFPSTEGELVQALTSIVQDLN